MDERREPEPAAGTPATPLLGVGRLSPPREAWAAYVGHSRRCPRCHDIDAGPCDTAAQLHRSWRVLAEAAMDQFRSETA